MKILCLIEALGSGGAERQLTGLAAMLKEKGNDVKVVTYYHKDFYRSVLDKAGVKFEYLAKAQSKIRRIPELAKAIHSFRPEAVIAYSPSAAEVTCLLKRIGFKYKLIVSERNTTQFYDKREKVRFYSFRWADWIVPNSHSQSRFIIKHCPNLEQKIQVITNFVDIDYFSPSVERKAEDERIRMVCVGRLFPQKNVLSFLDVVKRLKDNGVILHIEWYGHNEGEYADECMEKVKHLGIEGMITFKGAVENVLDVYRSADVFCLPSLYEGFPNVVCEAMSCGVPVLCSRVCDNPDIVENHKQGLLFDPTSVDDMTNTITHFLGLTKEERQGMRVACREKAVRMFAKEHFIEQYEQLLK